MENSFGFRRGKHSPAPKPRLEALATSPLSFLHHPTTTMADHAPLVNFLSRLNTDVGAGTDKEFLAATGRRLIKTHPMFAKPNPGFGLGDATFGPFGPVWRNITVVRCLNGA